MSKNEKIKGLEETNKLVNSTLVYLLVWDKEYKRISFESGEKKQVTFEYIEIIKKFVKDTKDIFRNQYNINIK